MAKNADYLKGIKFLRYRCKMIGFDIRKYEWIADLSSMLSETNNCYMFWYNVFHQKKLDHIPCCFTVYDILFHPNLNLLCWSFTPQGDTHWRKIFRNMFYKNIDSIEISDKCRQMRLSEIYVKNTMKI